MLVLNIAQDLVEGRDILGYLPWNKKWRVLYVNFELPHAELRVRLALLGNSPLLIPVTLPMMSITEDSAPITDILEAFRLAEMPIDCLILDAKTALQWWFKQRTQTKDTSKWCAICDGIIMEYDLCMIIVHHYGRNESAKGGRGNTTFGAWATKRLELGQSGIWSRSETHKQLLTQGKVGEPLAIELIMEYPKWRVTDSALEARQNKLEEAATFILSNILKDKNGLLLKANIQHITTSTFNEAQKRLETDGRIRLEKAEGQ